MRGIRILVLRIVSLWLVLPAIVTVLSDPVIVDLNYCSTSSFEDIGGPGGPTGPFLQEQCCPPVPTNQTTIIEGLPTPMTIAPQFRLASQCTDAVYAEKLNRAYDLMRALPDDDPRSFYQQWRVHCAYCGASFFSHNITGGNTPGIDIHFSWFFFPWHRLFIYFHERILAYLLDDPTFKLSFWNWDSAYTIGGGSNTSASCFVFGNNFPTAYMNISGGAYTVNRSANAQGLNPIKFPDLSYSPTQLPQYQTLYNSSDQTVTLNNLGVMKTALVTGATTTEIFLGRAYRAGEARGAPSPVGGGGSLEATAHASVHCWTGLNYPVFSEMGSLWSSARDPVFYSHHSNIDRLWEVWKTVSVNNTDYTDPDWLNAQFQFYDENQVLRKVNVSDALDTTKLGYVYQGANDAAWINFEPTTCSTLSYTTTLASAQLLPAPALGSDGSYYLTAGQPFISVVNMPASNGFELLVSVNGIQVAGMVQTGFDVYLNWLNPQETSASAACSEYVGRFMNVASPFGRMGPAPGADMGMIYQQSISVPLERTGVPQPGPSDVVVVLLPLSTMAANAITFSNITIGPAPIPVAFVFS